MIFNTVLLSGLALASSASAHITKRSRFAPYNPLSALSPKADKVERVRCSSNVSSEVYQAAEDRFSANRILIDSDNVSPHSANISVYFHVISADDSEENGNIPDDQISQQIDVLNEDYEDTGLTFVLANTTRTVNETWFKTVGPDTDVQTDMKNQLRQGDEAALNVYTVGFQSGTGAGLLGYSTFPSSYEDNPQDDGVVIMFSSLPGGSLDNFNLGKTLVHEAGHWVGLFHTFQNGCSDPGDNVDDTPAEAQPNSGCPTTAPDTCPDSAGSDPINNFMDYSYDACLDSFSKGQISRLQDQMATFRGVNFSSS
ncbi:zincin [Schizophyllum commune Tattone D]|nr:zincin [Schizophyllum commune Tattone D]